MNRIFRISGAAIVAAAGGVLLAPVSAPILAQTAGGPGKLTCVPATVSVGPSASVSGSLDVTCTTATGGTGGTPSCSVSISPSTLSSTGGTVNVAASNCGTISGWTGVQSSANTGTTAASFSDTLPANTGTANLSYTYTVTGTGTPASASAKAVVQAPPGTGGGGGVPPDTSCASTSTQLPWSAGGYSRVGPFTISGGSTVTAYFTAGASTLNSAPKISLAQNTTKVTWALASAPCSFPTPTDPVIGGPGAWTNTGTYDYFSVTAKPTSYLVGLTPGNTYYVNVMMPSGKGSATFYIDLYN
ncbi:MAG: hypothetical protein JSS46_10995 [Proteobacteria bacterium]|jgi:hypothetical protein|nr:hypothetical protein [Pseudomonadota bacterium]